MDDYCPYCQRTLAAENIRETEPAEHEQYIFIHDDVERGNDFNFSEVH